MRSSFGRKRWNVTAAFVFLFLLLAQTRASLDPGREVNKKPTHERFGKITKGEEAPSERFLYMCSLRRRGGREHVCGGTLIAPRWVLTAAHCLDPKLAGTTGFLPVVYCGIHAVARPTRPYQIFHTVEAVVHENWQHDLFHGYDIALLRLDREAVPEFKRPQLDSAKGTLRYGAFLTATGWGKTETGRSAEVLMMTRYLMYLPRKRCKETLQRPVKKHWVCAGMYGRDTCSGDSGGPLLVADAPAGDISKGDPLLDILAGVTSFAYDNKCDGQRPGLYTSVEYFHDWINEILNEEFRRLQQERVKQRTIEDRRIALELMATAELERRAVEAIREDNAIELEAILLDGIDVDTVYHNQTLWLWVPGGSSLFHWAAYYAADETAKVLVRYDADIERLDGKNRTPLHVAAARGSTATVEVLLNGGAELETRSGAGETALLLACGMGHAQIAKILLDTGADIEARSAMFLFTPLLAAADSNYPDIMEMLIERGAKVEVLDRGRMTPLHWASENPCAECVKILLKNEARVDAKDGSGLTPLYHAVTGGDLEVIKILVRHGADVNAAGDDGETPLHNAADLPDLQSVLFLIDYGADTHARTRKGETPLHFAAGRNAAPVVKLLLSKGVDVNAMRSDGSTPLHLAAARGAISAAKELVDSGASKHIKNAFDQLPVDGICSDSYCSGTRKAELKELLVVESEVPHNTAENGGSSDSLDDAERVHHLGLQ